MLTSLRSRKQRATEEAVSALLVSLFFMLLPVPLLIHAARRYPIPFIIVLAFIIRAFFVFIYPAPSGVDTGAYVESMYQTLGMPNSGIVAPGIPGPLLSPGPLMWPFMLFGIEWGTKLWTVITPTLAALAAWPLASRMLGQYAVIAVGGVAFDWWLVELVWAGSTPLMGIALIMLCMWGVMESQTWRGRIAIAASIPILAHLSMTVSGIAAVALPVFTVAWWWFNRKKFARKAMQKYVVLLNPKEEPYLEEQPGIPQEIIVAQNLATGMGNVGRSLRAMAYALDRPSGFRFLMQGMGMFGNAIVLPVAVGLLLSLTALPWYLVQGPGSDLTAFDATLWKLGPWSDHSWRIMMLAIIPALWMLSRRNHPGIRALGITTLCLMPLAASWSSDESVMNVFYRSRFLIAAFAWFGVASAAAALGPQVWWSGRAQRAATVMLVAGLIVGYSVSVRGYSEISIMRPEMVEAMDLIRAGDGNVASNSGSIAYWTAAYTGRSGTWAQMQPPPPAYRADYEGYRCILGWRTDCDPLKVARDMGIGWVLVDEHIYFGLRYEVYGAPPEPWAALDTLPWLELVYEKGQVRAWKVK